MGFAPIGKQDKVTQIHKISALPRARTLVLEPRCSLLLPPLWVQLDYYASIVFTDCNFEIVPETSINWCWMREQFLRARNLLRWRVSSSVPSLWMYAWFVRELTLRLYGFCAMRLVYLFQLSRFSIGILLTLLGESASASSRQEISINIWQARSTPGKRTSRQLQWSQFYQPWGTDWNVTEYFLIC